MVLTAEEKKAYMKEYYQKNKEKLAKKKREYYQKNKEVIDNKAKEYDEKNKEAIAEYKKKYQKEYNQTPKGKKITTIKNWKSYGLIHENINELYNKYLDATNCEVCKYVFDETNWRCMDHDHDTGLFRQFLCNRCNVMDNWKKLV